MKEDGNQVWGQSDADPAMGMEKDGNQPWEWRDADLAEGWRDADPATRGSPRQGAGLVVVGRG